MSTTGNSAAYRRFLKRAPLDRQAATARCKTQPAASESASTTPLSSSGLFWFSALLLVAITAILLTAALEWEHYRQMYAWQRLKPAKWDRAVLLWLMLFKSLILLVPMALVATALHRTGWRRLGRALLFAGWSLLVFWWVADLVVQHLAGNHLLDYLPYIADVLRPGDPSAHHSQWAGGWQGIAGMGLMLLAAVIAAGLLLMLLCHQITQALARHCHAKTQRRLLWAANLGLVGLILEVLPAQAGVRQNLLLRQLQVALPVDISFVDPRVTGIGHLLGNPFARGREALRILAVVPNPTGLDDGNETVHLHNFSDEPVDITGWYLTNTFKQSLKLEGVMAPGETRVITPPAGRLTLRNKGDRIRLFDAARRKIDDVSYDGRQVRSGTPIYFHRAEDFDDFLIKINASVSPIYRQYHEAIAEPPPMDEEAVAQPQGDQQPPHVLWLVCESLRHDVISPQGMSRLDAWSNSGLRLRQHYAGSNCSNLGVFHLLYGRSAFTYNATLDRKLPPQATVSMQASGYECSYISSGAFAQWRRMGDMINETTFDRVEVKTGSEWRNWPVRDRAVLDRAAELITTAERPQFIVCFLMTTHFPYPSPKEFHVHQPVGDMERGNWTTEKPSVLHNRYRNSALCLEAEILRCLKRLDPQRTIVMITGDHGESFGDDGGLAHGTKASEIQMRVPAVMVGPGVPAREINTPTTHADLLPTLLSVLSGKPVTVRHSYGHDVLSSPPREQLSIVPYSWSDTQLLLVRNEQRMLVNLNRDRPVADVTGFVNMTGQLDLNSTNDLRPSAAFEWSQCLRAELERITR